jgi:hypothetical protein
MKVIRFRTLEKDEDAIVVWSAQTNFGRVVNFMHRNSRNLKKIREFSHRGKLVRIFKFAE